VDGAYPQATLVMDTQGNLYGTTAAGGTGAPCSCGTVFKLDPSGNETILHSFTGGTDGASPDAGLVLDAQGNLYGTTYNGGLDTCSADYSDSGCGVVFRLAPQ
jgi:uncharacterized repeat protein (TIGR03803 family)